MGREKTRLHRREKGIVAKVNPDKFEKLGVGLIMDDHNYSSADHTL